MKRTLAALLLVIGLCLGSSAQGEESDLEFAGDRDGQAPRLGLVLAGGGARGASHVGVIRVLEEIGIRPDYIAGTSMGAIVGGLYAAGMGPEEMEDILSSMDWDRVLSRDVDRRSRTMRRKLIERNVGLSGRVGFSGEGLTLPVGVLQGQYFDDVLNRVLGQTTLVKDFDSLPIPFRAVAADLETGDPVVLGSGNLVQAIRASMSVPAVFAPVLIDDRILVDGGVAMNTPVEVVRDMGADVLIVVDLSPTPRNRDQLNSILGVTDQLALFLTQRNTRQSLSLLGDDDIVIAPDLGDITSAQFERSLEAVKTGELAARASLEPLKALAARMPRTSPDLRIQDEQLVLNFIDIDNTSRVDDALIRSRLRFAPGDYLDPDDIEASMVSVRALDVFESVRYTIVDDPERGTGALINAHGRVWGPNYLQFGLGLATDFELMQDFTLAAVYSRNAVSRYAGNVTATANVGRSSGLSADYYQPLDRFGRWFFQPGLAWSRDRIDLFDNTASLGTVQLGRWGGDLIAGRNFGPGARLSLGYAWGRENIITVRGLRDPAEAQAVGSVGRFHRGELTGHLIYDTLNDLHFPTRGSLLDLGVTRSSSTFGADIGFTQYELAAVTSATRGQWTVVGRGLVGVSSSNELPISDQFRLGGFGKISGRPFGSLLGEQAALFSISGQRRMADLQLLPIYAGASIEAGNTWRDRSDMSLGDLRFGGSLYLGIDSFLGPVYLSAGLDDDSNQSVYFIVGNPFELRRR